MDTITTIDALVEKFKACCKDYPESFALGALKAHFGALISNAEKLLAAIEAGNEPAIKTEAYFLRSYLNRLEQDANPVA